jgi:twitching motility protein PilT
MSSKHSPNAKVYRVDEDHCYSMNDLLAFFSEHGRMRVSDLHVKVNCPPVYRMDGKLQKMNGPPVDAAVAEALVLSLLADEEAAALKRDRAVDSSYSVQGLQFRINCFHENDGLAVAVRALEASPPEIEQIGFPNDVWMDIVSRQSGLVLVTGITGAGKSTTIAALIARIARVRPCRILTLEDPIEYRLASQRAIISQREVGRDVPSFERGLRDCLREDPDVIFVGEMRDRVSATWTLSAAETGHLVFSTLHTRDARGTITRVLDMFPAVQQDEVANQLSLGLSHVICQKLIPRGDGEGRVVAMEILNNTYAVANLVRLRKLEQVYSHLQTKTKDTPQERMTTLERSLARLVGGGLVSPQEAEKWANDAAVFLDEMKRLSRPGGRMP